MKNPNLLILEKYKKSNFQPFYTQNCLKRHCTVRIWLKTANPALRFGLECQLQEENYIFLLKIRHSDLMNSNSQQGE